MANIVNREQITESTTKQATVKNRDAISVKAMSPDQYRRIIANTRKSLQSETHPRVRQALESSLANAERALAETEND